MLIILENAKQIAVFTIIGNKGMQNFQIVTKYKMFTFFTVLIMYDPVAKDARMRPTNVDNHAK